MTSVLTQPPTTATAAERGQALFARASARLRKTVAFDGAGWFAVDPSTILPVSPARIENVETGQCESYWDREGRVEDMLLFRDLASAPHPVGSLRAATGDNPGRSARFREYLDPQGYGDELRAAFRLGDSTWGVAVLLRDRGRPAFSARDVGRVTAIGPAIAAAVASFATADGGICGPDAGGGPGTALFTSSGSLLSSDEQAERWFEELAGPDWASSRWLISTISALVARSHAVAAGRDRGPSAVRLRSSTGQWLSVHASCLRGPGGTGTGLSGTAAVVVEPALPSRIAPIVAAAYGLTPREQQVARGVARGLSNAHIAKALHLSAHTVRDHLKAAFAKAGVASRGELVARLFADPVRPGPVGAERLHVQW